MHITFFFKSLSVVIISVILYGVLLCGTCYKGAGIMPYALNPKTGAVELLLSRECHGSSRGKWSDFGGKRDWFEHDAAETALREYCEESNDLCGGYDEMKAQLNKKTTYRLETDRYVMFLVRMEHKADYNKDFQKRLLTAPTHCHKEKDLVLWVPVEKILDFCIYATPCTVGSEIIPLRNCFAQFVKSTNMNQIF